jgi:hypothetical protein
MPACGPLLLAGLTSDQVFDLSFFTAAFSSLPLISTFFRFSRLVPGS